MKKWLAMGMIILFVLMCCSINVTAAMTNYSNVQIDAFDDEGELLVWADSGDDVDVEVTSDLAVNVYIMASEDYLFIFDVDYTKAKYMDEGTTSSSFTYTIPNDESYYIVIYNPNNETATVDYAYTDLYSDYMDDLDENLDEAEDAFIFAGMVCILIIVIIVVVIIVVIVLIIKMGQKKQAQQQYAPPPPGYGQQPPPPPPPPPQY